MTNGLRAGHVAVAHLHLAMDDDTLLLYSSTASQHQLAIEANEFLDCAHFLTAILELIAGSNEDHAWLVANI